MARLNELPQPATESIDALKRRFVRQNREIAKANSTQSLRIRTLETEVSRLLAENVSLREQIIKLHYEVESNASKPESSVIDSFKARLEAKLKEVGDLVLELGEVQQAAKKRGQRKRRSLESKSSPRRSPNQRSWKTTQTLADLMDEADGRLPPILEGKQFPRRTLDINELHNIIDDEANITDSPDLGPPPVAHFEEGDPINFDGQGNRRSSSHNTPISEPASTPLSVNLETRKRRRESIQSKSSTPENIDDRPNKQAAESKGQPLKAGAKRKLNERNEDDLGPKEVEKTGQGAIEADKLKRSGSQKPSERPSSRAERVREASKENSTAVNPSSRKVLGPKSANVDPQSPAKSRSVETKDKSISSKETLANRMRERSLQAERARIKSSAETVKPVPELPKPKEPDILASVEPETPAPASLDLFSPASTEPSARQEGRGDTPPPPDLGPNTDTGSFGRASRRSRGSISYAEPNLRDKMRRPTKELVDAVGAEEQRARQARADKIKSNNYNSIESAFATMGLETRTTDAFPINWKGMPAGEIHAQKERQKSESTSPLGSKKATLQQQQQQPPDLPSTVTADRRRRASTLPKSNIDNDKDEEDRKTLDAEAKSVSSRPASAAASTIAALAKTTKRRQDVLTDHDKADVILTTTSTTTAQHNDRLRTSNSSSSIFDFTGSSPDISSSGGGGSKRTFEKTDEPSSTRASSPSSNTTTSARIRARRHSSVPALSDHISSSSIGGAMSSSNNGSSNGSISSGRGSLTISRRARRESAA